MADSAEIYDVAIEYPDSAEWLDDADADIRVLLLKAAGPPTFVATHATVKAVLDHANNTELTDGSYSRVTVPDTGRNVNSGTRTRQLRFDAAVDFGALTGETVGAALVYAHNTDIADPDDASIPLTLIIYNPTKVANGAGFTVGTTDSVVIEREGVTNP